VTSHSEFRTSEQEVLKLLEECAELRRTLTVISGQLGRMENRVKHAFPKVAAQMRDRKLCNAHSTESTITANEALAEFDKVVRLAASGANEEAQRLIEGKPAAELFVIAKEVGVTFPKSKPSVATMREAIFGKVRESVLLTRHHVRG
jgi:hypothetical protein